MGPVLQRTAGYFRGKGAVQHPGNSHDPLGAISELALPKGFRLIGKEDATRQFSTGEALMDRFTMEYYYKRSRSPDTLVLVLEDGGMIAAVSMVIVRNSSITIEMLARNALHAVKGAGGRMLGFIESGLAEILGINTIRLEALDRKGLLEFYRRKGFIESGPAQEDREWGVLHPMVKRVIHAE